MFSVPWRKNVERLEAGPAQVGGRALPDGRPWRPVDRRGNQHHGCLPRDWVWAAERKGGGNQMREENNSQGTHRTQNGCRGDRPSAQESERRLTLANRSPTSRPKRPLARGFARDRAKPE